MSQQNRYLNERANHLMTINGAVIEDPDPAVGVLAQNLDPTFMQSQITSLLTSTNATSCCPHELEA